MSNCIEILNRILKGEFISRFSVGDTWGLCIGDYVLTIQDVISEDEAVFNQWMQRSYGSFHSSVDQANISKSAIIAAHMRKEITNLNLDELCNLTMTFVDDSTLLIPTDVDIVDWQWCLNKTGEDPYMDYIVACFWQGEISISKEYVNNL
jgi:hypothetical protein